jgi:hypothetical protein
MALKADAGTTKHCTPSGAKCGLMGWAHGKRWAGESQGTPTQGDGAVWRCVRARVAGVCVGGGGGKRSWGTQLGATPMTTHHAEKLQGLCEPLEADESHAAIVVKQHDVPGVLPGMACAEHLEHGPEGQWGGTTQGRTRKKVWGRERAGVVGSSTQHRHTAGAPGWMAPMTHLLMTASLAR